MINYSCDLCGAECDEKVFTIPIAATYVGKEPYDLMPVDMNLCRECRSVIYRAAETRASKEVIKHLNKISLNIKMNRF